MAYWGKVAGAVAGLATGQPWLALIGAVLGHQFDQGYASHRSAGERASRAGRPPEEFASALFSIMGHLAKSDGRVTEAEIRAARIVMHRLGLGPARVRAAIACFEDGKQPEFSLAATMKPVVRACARHPERRTLFVRLLLEVSLSKGAPGPRERAALWRVCSELGMSRVELAQLEATMRAQRGFRRAMARDDDLETDSERLQKAYTLLGVSRSATNEEIKQAYRRAMNRNHPDKLSGRQADAAAVAAAQLRTREIRGAYDMLRVRRSMR